MNVCKSKFSLRFCKVQWKRIRPMGGRKCAQRNAMFYRPRAAVIDAKGTALAFGGKVVDLAQIVSVACWPFSPGGDLSSRTVDRRQQMRSRMVVSIGALPTWRDTSRRSSLTTYASAYTASSASFCLVSAAQFDTIRQVAHNNHSSGGGGGHVMSECA